jgi:hypothetical protein
MLRDSELFQIIWTLLSVASAFLVCVFTVAIAWNETDLVVWLYGIPSGVATIGLLAGLYPAPPRRKLFNWIACISAIAIALLSAICTAVLAVAGYSTTWPLVAIYVGAFLCCSVQAWLAIQRIRDQKAP